MGLMIRRRRPVIQLAGAAALGTAATRPAPAAVPTDDEFAAATAKLLGI